MPIHTSCRRWTSLREQFAGSNDRYGGIARPTAPGRLLPFTQYENAQASRRSVGAGLTARRFLYVADLPEFVGLFPGSTDLESVGSITGAQPHNPSEHLIFRYQVLRQFSGFPPMLPPMPPCGEGPTGIDVKV